MDVYVPKKNLGVPRSEMPQISSKKVPDFVRWLQDGGVRVSRKRVRADKLNATQREINRSKVEALASNPSHRSHLEKPVIVSKDGYLMDGHHRWMALLTIDPDAVIPVVKVDLKIRDLLEVADDFDGVTRKDLAASLLRIAREILR
jgi:ParB-like chromosome segregation protein Spo0J